jgi:4'-phosphopantetheinyl transferase
MEFRDGNMAAAVGPEDFATLRVPLRGLAMPAPHEIHLWFLDLAKLARSLKGALDGHDDGTADVDFSAGQLRFARQFFVRLLLGGYLGLPGKAVRINRSERGKPSLDASHHPQELHFSMAKSGSSLLLGFSTRHHLGVDLEPAGRRAHNAMGVARRYFSPAEAKALAALPTDSLDAAFLRAWACKEAVVKASGEGIANQLCRFTVETDPTRTAAVLDFEQDDPREWTLAVVIPDDDYLGAVAVRDPGVTVRAFRLLPSQPPAG